MNEAENQARKAHKSAGAAGVERMVNGAKLRVLERNLGVPIKRNRDPGRPSAFSRSASFSDSESNKGESVIIKVDK